MKRIIALFSVLLISVSTVSADFNYIIEPIGTPQEGVEVKDDLYIFEYEEQKYYVYNNSELVPKLFQYLNENSTSVPRIYEEEVYNFFKNDLKCDDYIYLSDGGFLAYRNCATYEKYFASEGWKWLDKNYVYFYDENLNLISERLSKGFIKCIYEQNGCCYFESNGENYSLYESIDKKEWKKISNDWQDLIYKKNGFTYKRDKALKSRSISFNNGNTFNSIIYENDYPNAFILDFPLSTITTYYDYMFSKNFIYFVDISNTLLTPKSDENQTPRYFSKAIWYFSKDYFVMEVYSGDDDIEGTRLKIPRDEFEAEMKKASEAPFVILNDKVLGFTQPPVIEDGRTLVPMRFLFEQMGAKVDWDGETKSATATLNGEKITFGIDNKVANVNNRKTTMDVPARLINDKTMVPLRFLSENLGYTVDWDGEKRIITIEN